MSGKTQEALSPGYEQALGRAADVGLFSSGGSFESYPGAVLLTGHNGLVLGANEAAQPIAELLKQDAPQDLRDAINAALEGKAAQITPLLVDQKGGQSGVELAFDIAILPWCDGAAALLLGRDITLERSLRAALIESRQRYKDLVDASSDLAWEVDEQGRFSFVSPKGALGYSAGELVGRHAADLLIEPEDSQVSPFSAHQPIHNSEVWIRRADGEAACLLVTALPLIDAAGAWQGVRGLCRDITADRQRQAALAGERLRERLLSYVLGMVRDEMDPQRMLNAAANALIPALPASGVVLYRRLESGEFERTSEAGDLPANETLTALLEEIAEDNPEQRLVTEEGSLFMVATSCRDTLNGALFAWRRSEVTGWSHEDLFLLGEIAGQIGVANSQLAERELLKELSSTDPLTGLLNRRGFEDCLRQRYGDSSWQSRGSALLFIDLDNFKPVNDRHGHEAGDRLLLAVAQMLKSRVRAGDFVARLGGDEFGVYLDDIVAGDAARKGRAFLDSCAELQAHSADPERPIGMSIGIAMADPERNELFEDLLRRADKAMYAVKRRGKGGFELWEFERGVPHKGSV